MGLRVWDLGVLGCRVGRPGPLFGDPRGMAPEPRGRDAAQRAPGAEARKLVAVSFLAPLLFSCLVLWFLLIYLSPCSAWFCFVVASSSSSSFLV